MAAFVDSTLFILQNSTTESGAMTQLILRSSPIAKAVLLLLLVFSIISWTIVFAKWLWFRRAQAATTEFLARFRAAAKLSDLYVASESHRHSPLARVFLAGYDEITNQMNDGASQVRSVDSISRVLQSAAIDEVNVMERGLTWLATAANASPFIGLFGTVVGIIIAFHGLSTATASSIQAVAPGIAEALIATAAGIAVAVPAAIFYNHFLSRIKSLTSSIDRFSLELINFIERNYVRVESLSR